MNRSLLPALIFSLVAVIGTVGMMCDKKMYNVEQRFPAFERHILNEVMATVKVHGTKIEKQEAEQATRLLSKICERTSFNRESLENIRKAARLVLDTARHRERALLIAENRSLLIDEIARIDPRPIAGTPSLESLNAILADARRRARILSQCRSSARSCTALIAEFRQIGPFMRGDAMISLVSSEVGDTMTTDEIVARCDELIAYMAKLKEKVRRRRESLLNAPRHSQRIRAA